MDITAEVSARLGERTEIIRISASRTFFQELNRGLLSVPSGSDIGINLLITEVFRLYDGQGNSMDVTEPG